MNADCRYLLFVYIKDVACVVYEKVTYHVCN